MRRNFFFSTRSWIYSLLLDVFLVFARCYLLVYTRIYDFYCHPWILHGCQIILQYLYICWEILLTFTYLMCELLRHFFTISWLLVGAQSESVVGCFKCLK